MRVRVRHPAVCEEPTNSGRIRKRDFLITAAVFFCGGSMFVEKLPRLNALFTVCIRVSPERP